MEPSEPTERDKYIESLEAKLRKAGRAKRFVEHDDGKLIIELFTEKINAILKIIAGKALLDNQTEYAYQLGKLHSLQEQLTVLQTESSRDTADIQNRIRDAKNDV